MRSMPCSSLQVAPVLAASSYSAAIHTGSVSTSVPSMSHSTACSRRPAVLIWR